MVLSSLKFKIQFQIDWKKSLINYFNSFIIQKRNRVGENKYGHADSQQLAIMALCMCVCVWECVSLCAHMHACARTKPVVKKNKQAKPESIFIVSVYWECDLNFLIFVYFYLDIKYKVLVIVMVETKAEYKAQTLLVYFQLDICGTKPLNMQHTKAE